MGVATCGIACVVLSHEGVDMGRDYMLGVVTRRSGHGRGYMWDCMWGHTKEWTLGVTTCTRGVRAWLHVGLGVGVDIQVGLYVGCCHT